MLKVLITHSLPEEGLKELREKFNIIMPKSGQYKPGNAGYAY